MNREEFLEKMVDIIQTEESLNFDTVLEDLEDWDSLSKMSTLTFLDTDFGVKISFAELSEMKTLEDIAQKAGI